MPWPILVLLVFAGTLIWLGVLLAIVDALSTIRRARRMVR